MFAARSVHDTNHSYLSATNEGYVAATKTELKADVVFKLEYINNNYGENMTKNTTQSDGMQNCLSVNTMTV